MNLSRQLVAYAVIGGLQWLFDCSLTMTLSHSLLPVAQANIAGRLAGAALGFWLNGRYTFGSAGNRLGGRPLARFALVWLTLTLIGSLLLGALEQHYSLPPDGYRDSSGYVPPGQTCRGLHPACRSSMQAR